MRGWQPAAPAQRERPGTAQSAMSERSSGSESKEKGRIEQSGALEGGEAAPERGLAPKALLGLEEEEWAAMGLGVIEELGEGEAQLVEDKVEEGEGRCLRKGDLRNDARQGGRGRGRRRGRGRGRGEEEGDV